MSSTGPLSELESLRWQVAALTRTLAERDQVRQDGPEQANFLRAIVEGTSADIGVEFFRSLVKHLALALNVRYAFVGEWREPTAGKVSTLAVWSGTDFVEPFEYNLKGSPCEHVIGQQLCLHESGIQERFSDDRLLVQLGVQIYCGMPLFDRSGTALGLLVVMDDRPFSRSPLIKDLLPVFATRAAAELQRQQAEMTLQEQERQLRFTQFSLDHAADAVLWADDATKFIYANGAACRSLGYTNEELLTLSIPDIAPHHDPAQFHKRLDQAKQGTAVMYESVHRRKDGTEFPIEVSVTYLEHDGRGYTCGIVRDITERKQAEKALRESETFNISVLNSLSSQIVVLNSQGVIMAVNKPWLQFAEENEASHLVENFVGMNYLNACAQAPLFAHGEEAASAQAGILAVLAGTHNEFSLEYPCHSPDQQRWFRMRVTPLLDSQAGVVVAHENITERRQAEEALRKSEGRYARATAVGKVGVWELDVAAGTYYGDPNLKGLFGYVGDELSTDPYVWLNLVHPDDRSIAMDHWQRIVNGETDNYHYELRMLKKDGMVIWTDVQGHAIRGHEGQVIQLLGTTVDVTERKQAQDALVQSERQIHTVLDALPVGVWFTDQSRKPLLVNPMAKQIWSNIKQIEPQTPSNQSGWWDISGPVSEVHSRALTHTLRTGVPSQNEILDFECLDGTRKTIRNTAVPVQDETGVVVGAIVLNEDITALRRAQEAIKLTQFSIDHAVEAFFWIGPDAKILHVNEAACRMLEYTSDELTAMTVHDIDPNFPPELWSAQWEDLKQKGSLSFESKHWSRTGRVLDTEVTVNYLQYDGREYNCAIMRNIGERKRADEALRTSEERYRALYDETPTMYFTLATDGTVCSVNRFGADQLGYQVEELVGHSVLRIFHEDDKEAVSTSLSECLTTPETTKRWEFRKVRKDGRILWVRETARVGQSSAGEAVLLVTCEDITAQKLAEAQQARQDDQLQAIFRMTLTLSRATSLDDIYREAIDCMQRALKADRASIRLFDEAGAMRFKASRGLSERYQSAVVGHSLWTSKTVDPQTILIDDISSDPSVAQYREVFDAEGIKALGFIPLVLPERLLGKFMLYYDTPHHFTEEEVGVAKTIAGHVAYMIQRTSADQALRVSEERHRSLVDNAPIGIFVNEAGRFTYVNREMQRILRATHADQLIGMPVLDRIAPEFHQIVQARIRQLIEKGQPVPPMEQQFLRLDGSRIDVAVTAITTSFEGTTVMQVLVRDITNRKKAEEEIRRSHAFLRQVIDINPNFVFAKDRAGRFTLVNKAVADAYGTTVENLIGKTDADFNTDEKEVAFFRETDLEVLNSLQDLFFPEEVITDSMGKMRWLQTVKRPLFNEQGQAIMVLVAATDITERKRMEEALRQRERDLRAAIEERERISQDLHDGILQSLFAVGLSLETTKSMMSLKERKTSGPALTQAIDQLNRLMHEVRNFIAGLGSDLLQGKDLPTALHHMLKTLTKNHPTHVRLKVEDRAAQALSAEQSLHLLLVIQEAVSNCIRHGHAQEATVSLKLLKQGVRLSVRDNGCGFDSATSKGIGHGLANMAARAQKIGGRLTVLSKTNEGTRVVLDLPKEAALAHS